MNALTKSMEQNQAFVTSIHDNALQAKAGGVLGDQLSPGFIGGLDSWQNRSRDNRRYMLFRGWLYAAINVLASEAAGQAVNVGRLKTAEGGKGKPKNRYRQKMAKYLQSRMTKTAQSKATQRDLEVLGDHPLIDSLERPNFAQHRWQFVYTFVANLNLTGWAFIVKDVDKEGRQQFFSLPTTWVQPLHEKGETFSSFEIRNQQKPGSKGVILGRDQVAFAHLPNPSDPLSALAPAASQMLAIRIDDHIQTSQERFFENGIFPSVIVTVGKDPHPDVPAGIRPRLTGAQRRQVNTVIRKTVGGVANYGNPAIVDGLIEKIERLSATSNEMGWDKSEDKTVTRILSAFSVHRYILGDTVKAGGYAQVAKIEERFCKRVNTFLDMLGNLMTSFVGDEETNEKLLVWWDKCEPNDPALQATNMRFGLEKGAISRDEFRTFLGLPPGEDVTAKNPLLRTVGGMTGTVAIFTAIGQGIIPKDSASQLLSLFFEIPIQEAQGIVGEATERESLEEATEVLESAVAALGISPKSIADSVVDSSRLQLECNCKH